MENKTEKIKKEREKFSFLISRLKNKKFIFKKIIKYYLNDYIFWEHMYSFSYKVYYNRFYRTYFYKNKLYCYLLKLWDIYFKNIYINNKYYKDFIDFFFWNYEDNYSLNVENNLYLTTKDFIFFINSLFDFLSFEHFKKVPKYYLNIKFNLYFPRLL